ncbi:C2H2 C2HC zinc finger [Fusarium mexicanum]|uniref:C2H2 C2HC zinc finger n=1 Tax=Fusarium mexicanum TaxID=751941 RepID=A0A8H5MLD0_9HYPO|nr:C2H2 C2HC zinc finger [Fusarium mexicanum]
MASRPPIPKPNGFQRALADFQNRLKPAEKQQFEVTTLDELKVTILAIQSQQRSRKKLMHMGRLVPFLEAMEQFGKVIEVFLNVSEVLAFVWGPMKLLLLTAINWTESFDTLLDAYQRIAENFPIFEGYQNTFSGNDKMQTVMEHAWSNILEFHIKALRIFEQSMLKQFFRSLWKDFKTRFQSILEDLKRQKELVESHANRYHIHNYENDRLKMLAEFKEASVKRSAERKAFVSQWIAAPQTIIDHEHVCETLRENSKATQRPMGQWILNHEDLKSWLDKAVPKSSTIWVTSIAGAGKTVLASVIIDHLRQRGTEPVSFFYCKHGDPKKRTLHSFITAILSQLVAQQDQLVPYYYDEAIRSGEITLQSVKHCKTLLLHMLQNIPKAYIIMDGLDECDDNERKAILGFLQETLSICDSLNPAKLRALILSRDERDIRKALGMATIIRFGQQETLQDMKVYVECKASAIQAKFKFNSADREYIEQYVLDKSDGMFLFAKLVMSNLEGQPNLKSFYKEFHSLPQGLGQAYDRNLSRIRNNPNHNQRAMAEKIVSLVLCSRRPLRSRELQGAISIDPQEQTVDSTLRLSMDMRDICGSLIEIVPGGAVELVHATASTYIQDLGYIPRWLAELSMTYICLNYLTYECFEETSKPAVLKYIHEGCFAFQDYAIAHWTDHVLALLESLKGVALDGQGHKDDIVSAFTLFAAQYGAELASSSKPREMPDVEVLRQLDHNPHVVSLWEHSTNYKALTDDRNDKVSIGYHVTISTKALSLMAKDNATTIAMTDLSAVKMMIVLRRK